MGLPVTHMDFCIRSSDLDVEQIAALLNLRPTDAFNPGELYVGKTKVGNNIVSVERNRPNFGLWHYSTELLFSSDSLEEHGRFLLEALRPARAGIAELLANDKYIVRLILWHAGPTGFDLSSELVRELSGLCRHFGITCFDTDEVG